MKRWSLVVVLVLAAIGLCLGMWWADDVCRHAGGQTRTVGRGFACVSPDGRLINP